MSIETVTEEEADPTFDEVDELLVEEVSIDGLCGVY
ncbi:MAG TPA: mycofactocin precursor MftA [Acidimicrobiales bacterium]|nr:mycofactocin precursor MftA [Acidimicrobiales bacterium]